MAIKLRVAKSTNDILDSQKLRYQVFVEEEGVMKKNQQKIVADKHDLLSETIILNAYTETKKCIATIRMVSFFESKSVPFEDLFSLDDILKKRRNNDLSGKDLYSIGMLAIKKEHRQKSGIFSSLVKYSMTLLGLRNCFDAIAVVNHEIAPALQRIGFETLGRMELTGEITNIIEIMYSEHQKAQDKFLEEILPKPITELVPDCNRLILSRGEKLISQNDFGDQVYFVMSGTLGAYVQSDSQGFKVSNFFKPPLIGGFENMILGEMAVLESGNRGGYRSATVIVESRLAEVFICEGNVFRNALFGKTNPSAEESLAYLMLSDVMKNRVININEKLSLITPMKDYEDRLRRFLEVFDSKIIEAQLSCAEGGDINCQIFDFEWVAEEIGLNCSDIKPLTKQLLKNDIVALDEKKQISSVNLGKLKKFNFVINLV